MIGKPFFVHIPGDGRVETYPSIQDRRLYGGFEKVTIKVADVVISHLARFPGRAKEILAEIYPTLPPVDPRDIVAPLLDQKELTLTFSIRRGHFFLADFLRLHKDAKFEGKHLSCSCHQEKVEIFPSSFPTYSLDGD
jgi:hypothetical protein